jgi:hypothetical protein
VQRWHSWKIGTTKGYEPRGVPPSRNRTCKSKGASGTGRAFRIQFVGLEARWTGYFFFPFAFPLLPLAFALPLAFPLSSS